MPAYPDGTKIGVAEWDRLISSISTSYTIFKKGSVYYAEANFSGGTDYKNPDFSTVMQLAVDALPNGGKIF